MKIGGTDGKGGLWSIKSGELLFEERFMDSIPSQFCWGIKEGITQLLRINSYISSIPLRHSSLLEKGAFLSFAYY